MHRSRLGNLVIDCNTHDLLTDARFWSQALGYPLPEKIDGDSPFIQLQTPPGEVQVIIQRVQHEARAHLDIDSDSISAEVARLQRLGAQVVARGRLGRHAGAQRPPFLRRQPLPRRLRRTCQSLECSYGSKGLNSLAMRAPIRWQ